MKRTITIIKTIALLALVVAGVFGFIFVRVWQQNPGPRETSIRWQADETRLGAPDVLRVEMKLPWHQRPSSAQAQRLPDGWVAQNGGTWTEGALGLDGFRQWSLESTLVPVTTTPAAGGVIAWSLRAKSGPPPRAAEFTVPELTVIAPTELDKQPKNPTAALVYSPPVIAPVATLAPAPTRPWIWVSAIALLVIVAGFGHRLIRKRPVHVDPPWTRALANLSRLADAPLGEAQVYCTKLSDILKEYSTQRFECNMVGASSTEFLRELASRHSLADEDKQALKATLGHADLVRFAGAELAKDSAAAALENARRFVNNTTPTPDTDRA